MVCAGRMACAMPSCAICAILLACSLVRAALVATTAIVVLPKGLADRKLLPPGLRASAMTCCVCGSTMSPSALTTAIAPIMVPSASCKLAEPRPPFVMKSGPAILLTVAPVPAPTLPCARAALLACRHARHARVVAGAPFFQVAHDAACRVQSKGAAAREQNGIDASNQVHGAQQIGFARGRRAPAHIYATRRGCIAQNHCAARACLEVGVMSDTNAGNVGNVVMHRRCAS